MTKRIHITTLIAALAAWFVPPSLPAQSADSGPSLGVARVSLVNGDVTTRRGEAGDWIAAGVNTPLVEGDLLETGPGARTEIQLDYSNFLRLDGATTVELASLGNRNFRVRLLEGRVTYSELKGGEADVDIETAYVALRPQKNGRYEIESRSGVTVIQVRRGQAEVASPDGTRDVRRGRMLVVREGPDGLDFRAEADEPRGDWDRWNESRDDRLANAESYRYVDPSISGAHDLDHHGDWRYVSGYGHCWIPRVNAGWAPYRFGRWSWVDTWGWSWIGYEPWGWAPYHYGSWFNHATFGWTWFPGRRRFRHAWAPARVAFFGYSGRNFSLGLGFGFGNVGWIPLAPGERGYRWWGGGRGYFNRGDNIRIKNSTIIVDNSTNIYNNYRNARANNGVTVVDAQSFAQGRVNNPRSLRSGELQRASLMRGQIPVVPARASQGRIVRAANARSPRAATSARTFSRSGQSVRASAARPSFTQQQTRLAQSVREFRTGRAGSANGSSGVRAGNSVRGTSAGSVRSGTTRSGTARAGTTRAGTARAGSVRSSAATPSRTRAGTNGVRAGTSTRARTSNSGRTVAPVDRTNGVSRATRSGSRSGTVAPRTSSRIPQRSSSRVDRSGVRSGSRSGTVAPRTSSRIPQRSSSRVDRSGVRSGSRSGTVAPRTSSRIPQRSSSRVDRSGVRSGSRSGTVAPRTSSRIPQRSSSRVDRSGVRSGSRSGTVAPRTSSRIPQRSSSRVDRSGTRSSSRSGVSRSGSIPQRSSSRAQRSSQQRSSQPRSSQPRVQRSAPQRSAPSASRRSTPRVRSAPSRTRSSGGYSRPQRSSAPRVQRSAPSRGSYGGGARSSAPSRSSGGVRSAPSRGRAPSRSRSR